MAEPSPFRNALVLAGPTGSGKSALAIELAGVLDAEIVAMDSMTLYRGMDIGTAKPTLGERAGIPHHLLDVLDPSESANVAWYLREAAAVCQDIEARGRRPFFVGGTLFYLKAILFGLFDGPPANANVRARLEARAASEGADALHAELAGVDAISARRLHPNDVRRVVRALEVHELTGKPLSEWQNQWHAPPLGLVEGLSGPARTLFGESRCIWIDRPREELNARIEARVDVMLAAGWLDEVRRLWAGPTLSREAGEAIGYAELADHLAGRISLEEATGTIKIRSRQYARRQLTWLRHLPGCRPVSSKLTW